MKYIILLCTLSIPFHSFAYECKPKELSLDLKKSKKEQILILKGLKSADVYQGYLFELTKKSLPQEPAKARILANFLLHTEVNADQRTFMELLEHSSDLKSETPKALDAKEVCGLNAKVNKL